MAAELAWAQVERRRQPGVVSPPARCLDAPRVPPPCETFRCLVGGEGLLPLYWLCLLAVLAAQTAWRLGSPPADRSGPRDSRGPCWKSSA